MEIITTGGISKITNLNHKMEKKRGLISMPENGLATLQSQQRNASTLPKDMKAQLYLP